MRRTRCADSGQPDHEAPGGVADHVDRLAGESPGNVLQHTLEIVLPPVDPVGLEPTQPTVSRFADAAVVVGHHVPSVAVEPVGKARVVPAAHRGGRVDDRDRMPGVVDRRGGARRIHPRDSRRRRECRWAQPLLKGSGVGMHAGRGPEGRPRTVRVLQFWGVFRPRSSEKCSTSPEISTLGSKPPQKESTYGPIYGFRPCVFCAQDWMPALFVPGRRIRGWRRSPWRSGRVRPARSEDA